MARPHAFLLASSLTGLVSVSLLPGCAPGGPFSDEDFGSKLECPANLLPGELVISEIFARASDDGDRSDREWFELFNATAEAIDLEGVELVHADIDGSSSRSHAIAKGLSIAAGDYLVVGGVRSNAARGHLDYGYGGELGALRNSDGTLTVRCNVIDIDVVRYRETEPGASLLVDGASAPDATANDDESNFCTATIAGDFGGLGSPGAANEPCGPSTIDGRCDDGGTDRDIIEPTIGDLVITEFLANPSAVSDSAGEWIEVTATRSIDLNGLQVGRDTLGGDGLASAECLALAAGDSIVFASNASSAENGGLPDSAVIGSLGVGLVNSNGSVQIGLGGETLDQIRWTGSTAGVATQLDPARLDPTANDDATAFCAATLPYGDGDLGTPGAANPPCPGPEALAR